MDRRWMRINWQVRVAPFYINNFNSHMQLLQEIMDSAWKGLLGLSEIHLNLCQMGNLKIFNRQELFRNPYISDELRLFKTELLPIKERIESTCEKVRQVIQSLIGAEKYRQHSEQQQKLLKRVISRAIELSNEAPIQQDNEYYRYYNQKLKNKCARIIKDINEWQMFEIIKILYKYFRHVVLVELERYQEILECIDLNDFQSLQKLRDCFYEILLKKEISKKYHIANESPSLLLPMRYTPTPPVSEYQSQQKESGPVKSARQFEQTHEKAHLRLRYTPTPPISQYQSEQRQVPAKSTHQIEEAHDKNHLRPVSLRLAAPKPIIHDGVVNVQQVQTQSCPMIESAPNDPPVPSKRKHQNKSTKKLFVLLGPVMGIKKQHFLSEHANKNEHNSMLDDLASRNKANHKQINDYCQYAQQMEKHLCLNNTADFYYYKEEPPLVNIKPAINIEKSATQKKRVRLSLPKSQRDSIFSSQQIKKAEPQLTVPVEKPRNLTIHKSIRCRDKDEINAQVKDIVQQKPLKIDSDFLEINLRKVLPNRRQSQFDQMVARASSLGTIKQEIHTTRVKMSTDNAVKVNSEVFRSVKILHQGQFNAEKYAKIQREKEKHHQHQHEHNNRIQNRIKEELKGQHLQGRPEDLKKIWRDQLTFKKLQIG